MYRYTEFIRGWKPIILLMCVMLAIAGCGFTTTGDAFESTARATVAKAYDEGLINAEQFMCNDTSVGSVKRRYFRTVGDAKIYNDFCQQSGLLRVTPGPGGP
jgi:hypothetical protein